ncbi:hypothetical protein ACPCUV_36440 [Streptomyces platensis]|uniref:hypothetical protein n=1 Tax=Streptomyces platensis TaxID=58346 RepID=UPI003C2DEAA1
MLEPDAEASTPARPLWRGDTVARWCARSGRRLPPRTASWLLPGPDGPHLRRDGHTTLQLRQEDLPDHPDLQRPPIDVHVARYTTPGVYEPHVWVVTVLAPGQTNTLLGWPHAWPHGNPLRHLVHEILTDIDTDRDPSVAGGLLGTLVLLPTLAEPQYTSLFWEVRLLDLYTEDADDQSDEDLQRRMRRLRPSDVELSDLVRALGHKLPWWPPGCATPGLAASWSPDGPRAPEHVPPPLAGAQAFLRRCHSAAADLDSTLRTSVLELGNSLWHQAISGWTRGGYPDHGTLPENCDAAIWQTAVEFNLEPAPATSGDFWDGLEWVMEHAPSQRLAADALRYFGDPSSAGTVVVDTAHLPQPIKAALTEHVSTNTPEGPNGSYRAQRVLDALDAHPHTAAGSVLGTWPTPVGPAWCAASPEPQLTALHVPRTMPAPGPPTGTPLEAVLLRTAEPGAYPSAPAIGFVVTDQDQVMLLPGKGHAADLAAAIEHAVWHPGEQTLVVGLTHSTNERLTAAVEALVETGPRTTPWEQLTALVGPHPNDMYCPYCRRDQPEPSDEDRPHQH